jgi:propionate CoA-transferase
MTKFVSLEEVAKLIDDEKVIGVGGFCGFGAPDSVLRAIGKRYEESKHPKKLMVITPAAAGTGMKDDWGINAIGAPGLIDTVITSVIMLPRVVLDAINNNEIACYAPPLGYFGHMFRTLACKDPGYITHVGLNTYCDPRLEGCAMNQKAKDKNLRIVELASVDNKDYLFYPTIKIDYALLRGTYADEDGNISCDHEAIHPEILEMATAVHNNGGKVIFQVEKIVKAGSIDPRNVVVHKSEVDYVVLANPKEHLQSYAIGEFMPELTGEIKVKDFIVPEYKLSPKKVISRRACMEIKSGALVNLGLGISEGISFVAMEENILDKFTLSIETGILGGLTLSGGMVGAGMNADAYYKMADTFDLYNGGGLDQCFLSAAEVDEEGNVNVSKFSGLVNGPGGFINITQNTKKICFSNIFTAGKNDIRIENGKVNIVKDSNALKFVKKVEQVSFSGKDAIKTGKKVKYITERGVFELTKDGLMLIEIAPGVDLEKDILAKMEFEPLISDNLKVMDEALFKEEKMNLKLK